MATQYRRIESQSFRRPKSQAFADVADMHRFFPFMILHLHSGHFFRRSRWGTGSDDVGGIVGSLPCEATQWSSHGRSAGNINVVSTLRFFTELSRQLLTTRWGWEGGACIIMLSLTAVPCRGEPAPIIQRTCLRLCCSSSSVPSLQKDQS